VGSNIQKRRIPAFRKKQGLIRIKFVTHAAGTGAGSGVGPEVGTGGRTGDRGGRDRIEIEAWAKR